MIRIILGLLCVAIACGGLAACKPTASKPAKPVPTTQVSPPGKGVSEAPH